MSVKAVIFDAYSTLLRNEDSMLIPRRIVASPRLPMARSRMKPTSARTGQACGGLREKQG